MLLKILKNNIAKSDIINILLFQKIVYLFLKKLSIIFLIITNFCTKINNSYNKFVLITIFYITINNLDIIYNIKIYTCVYL